MGVDMMMSYIITVNERSVLAKVDTRTAACSIAHDFKEYRNLGNILKEIQKAKQELTLVGMQITRKQQPLKILTDLQNKGVTEAQIIKLVNFAGEWDKHWHPNSQSNNGGNNISNFQQLGNNISDGYGENVSMTNYIRLHMLKTSAANMLNRIGSIPR